MCFSNDLPGGIPTETLANLYLKQGFLDKAAAVYRALLEKDPERKEWQEAMKKIEEKMDEKQKAERVRVHLQKWLEVVQRRKRVMGRGEERPKVLVLHGPNLNMLGRRERSWYGSLSLDEINAEIQRVGERLGVDVETFQSNHEGELIEKVHSAVEGYDALIINPAAYTHTSIALRDALLILGIPIIEVHISNIYKREAFRQKSLMSDVVTAQLTGFGTHGYLMAVEAASRMIKTKKRRFCNKRCMTHPISEEV